MEKITIEGIELKLSHNDNFEINWVGKEEVVRQLKACWSIISENDLPMNPRIIGKPGVGKTSLAYHVAKSFSDKVYIFQCTADTRPEDLIVTPVISEEQKISYHASAVVTAMIKGGICILDEGNRMSEKSWASLAPLLDSRRYVESISAGIKIKAHKDFRICTTMNDDASTFDIPDYIQSRLQPRIELEHPTAEEELNILKSNLPDTEELVLKTIVKFLQAGHKNKEIFTIRDGINIGRYAVKTLFFDKEISKNKAIKKAVEQILGENALKYL
ncbi:MAG: AAA family ATPase [Candidatus Sericytochromatia bacterium]